MTTEKQLRATEKKLTAQVAKESAANPDVVPTAEERDNLMRLEQTRADLNQKDES